MKPLRVVVIAHSPGANCYMPPGASPNWNEWNKPLTAELLPPTESSLAAVARARDQQLREAHYDLGIWWRKHGRRSASEGGEVEDAEFRVVTSQQCSNP
jgi:hypothetical protein